MTRRVFLNLYADEKKNIDDVSENIKEAQINEIFLTLKTW